MGREQDEGQRKARRMMGERWKDIVNGFSPQLCTLWPCRMHITTHIGCMMNNTASLIISTHLEF